MDSKKKTEKIGQLLLQGWTMLAETCPFPDCNVPLMEKKKDGVIVCVSCGRKFKRDDDAEETDFIPIEEPISEKETPKQTPPNVKIDEQEIQKKQDKLSQVTKKMGEKLLSGWAMLADHCPRCNAPLMRDREKKMWCLNCEVQVMTEEEYKSINKSQEVKVNDSKQEISSSLPSSAKQTPIFEPEKKGRINKEDSIQQKKEAVDANSLDQTIQTLHGKIQEAQKLLANPIYDFVQATTLCNFIKECSSALSSLYDLKKKMDN